MALRNWFILFMTVILLVASGSGWLIYRDKHGGIYTMVPRAEKFIPVQYAPALKDSYDVIVVGTDPDGITAAISAARNGLTTLLVDGYHRTVLGGLMTEGWLNTIDMDYDKLNKLPTLEGRPEVLNKGIFSEWFSMIEGDSFDIHTAANAYYKLVHNEKKIDLFMGANEMAPIVGNVLGRKTVQGLTVTMANGAKQNVHTTMLIDATQNGDIAFAAGAPFTTGREDIGEPDARMAVTLVFKLDNITPSVWRKMVQRVKNDGDPTTGSTATSVYGYSGMRAYQPLNKSRVSMRGLNIGRQDDGTALSNSFLIYGINPFSEQSLNEARILGETELPRVVDFMKKTYPEFANIAFGGIAPEIYVRETRHLEGEYRLSVVDLLENKDQRDRIALGSYPVDIQPTSPNERGSVPFNPIQYAIPFRSLVPLNVDGLLVVGKAASYDSMAFGSVRVVPNGMAEGQSAGAAAAIALKHHLTFRQLSASHQYIAQLQHLLNQQGMVLKPFKVPEQPYMTGKDYAGLKVAVYFGLVKGGYNNHFKLDDATDVQTFANALTQVGKKYPKTFPSDPVKSVVNMSKTGKQPLTIDQASFIVTSAMNLPVTISEAKAELIKRGLLTPETLTTIHNPYKLTLGNMFMILKDVLAKSVGLQLS